MVISQLGKSGVRPAFSTNQLVGAIKYALYMSSNGLFTKDRMDDMVRWVVKHDHVRTVEALWKFGSPTVEIFVSQFLVSAVDCEYIDAVHTLLKLGVCPNSTSLKDGRNGYSALRYAILRGNSRLVKLLLDYGVDPNQFPGVSRGPSPLAFAFLKLVPHSGCLSEVVKILVNGGADIFRTEKVFMWPYDDKFGPLLCRAVETCTVEVIEHLLETNEGPARSLRGQLNHDEYHRALKFALHHAIASNKLEMARYFLMHGASVNGCLIGNVGCGLTYDDLPSVRSCHLLLATPIQLAAYYGSTQLVRMLLEKDGYPHGCLSPSLIQHLDVFIDMTEEDAESLVKRVNKLGPFTALHHSVLRGDLEMMQLLLEKGADPNATDGYFQTPLQMACGRVCASETDGFEVIHLLRKWGADVNSVVSGCTALNEAALRGNLELFKLLRRIGANVTHQPNTLQAAVRGHNLRIVEILSCGQLSVLCSDPKLLGYAIELKDQSPEMVNYLLKAGCNADALTWCTKTKRWIPPLVLAIHEQNAEVATILLNWGVKINSRGLDNDSHTPLQEALLQEAPALHYAHPPEDPDLFGMLIDRGADPNQILESIDFAEWLDVRFLHKLIEHGLNVNTSFPDSTTLFQAILQKQGIRDMDWVLEGCSEAALYLLGHGASPHHWNGPSFESSLSQVVYLAVFGKFIRSAQLELICELVSRGADANTCKVVDDYLIWEQCNHFSELASCAFQEEGAINAESESKVTVLQMASLSSDIDLDIINELLGAGAEVNSPAGKNSGLTALQGAVLSGRDSLVELLLDRGAEVNAPAASIRGWTALQAAAYMNNHELLEHLLNRGADVNSPAAKECGATALQYAAINGDLPMAIRLLDAGANVNAPGAELNGRTALEGAAEWGRLDMIHLLLNNDDEVETLGERCESAAKYAEGRGHVAIARILRAWQDR